ncbi:MFS transporter [Arthrobacter russicus]|uniref:MFS family permease n=1 Tax=Arthrobacter russicus TaxID=172040 RepID=A0ABU1JED3_9MICC|nr:MFS transporter [Arthrobacter russicus]MDR6270806.1 MFS family permease [Arthrobacter russicus]
MDFGQYRALLSVPAIRRLLIVAMLARVPHAAAGMVLTLHVVNTLGLGYVAAGGVTAAVTIGIAFGGPWRGRLLDKNGLRRTLVASIIAEVVVWSIAPFLPYWLLIVAAMIGGALAVPIFTLVRQAMGVMVSAQQRRTGYALDSIGTELTFMVGPAAGVALATVNTYAALIAIGIAGSLAGLFLFWFNPPTRSGQPGAYLDAAEYAAETTESFEELAPAEAAAGVPLPDSGRFRRMADRMLDSLSWMNIAILSVLAAAVGTGITLSGTDVGIVGVLREHGQQNQIGIVFLVWAGASLVGGLVYGSLHRKVNPLWLLAAMAVLTVPMGFASETWAVALLSIPPGLLTAPTLSSTSEWIADLVPEQRRGEAMGWFGSSITLGNAMGAPLAGAAIDMVGPWAGFGTVGVISAVLAVSGLIARGVRLRSAGAAAERAD